MNITRGNKHDARIAPKILDKIKINKKKRKKYILADKGYDSNKIGKIIEEKKYIPIIPKRKYKTKIKKESLKRRHIKIYKKKDNSIKFLCMDKNISKNR
jgi:hypothetical protein